MKPSLKRFLTAVVFSGLALLLPKPLAAQQLKLKKTLDEQGASVRQLAFSADGARLYALENRGVRIWETATWKKTTTLQQRVRYNDDPENLALHPSVDNTLFVGTSGGVVRWDLRTGKERKDYYEEGSATWVRRAGALSPDQGTLATGTETGSIEFWDTVTGKRTEFVQGRRITHIRRVTVSPSGKYLAWYQAQMIRIFDAATGEHLATLLQPHERPVDQQVGPFWGRAESLQFSPDESRIAVHAELTDGYYAGDGTAVCVWDWSKQKLLKSFFSSQKERVKRVEFTPDGKTLLIQNATENFHSHRLTFWDTITWEKRPIAPIRFHGGRDGVREGFALSPGGKFLSVWGDGGQQTVELWDAATGKLHAPLKGPQAYMLRQPFSPDGQKLATQSWDKTIRLWDVASGKEIATIRRLNADVSRLAFSPDSKMLTLYDHLSRKVSLYDTANGKHLFDIEELGLWQEAVFSPDSKWLAFLSRKGDRQLHLWDLTARKLRKIIEDGSEMAEFSFSPDSKLLVTRMLFRGAKESKFKVWQIPDGTPVGSLPQESEFDKVHFSKDSQTLFLQRHSSLWMWDVATRRVKTVLPPEHTLPVESLSFSPKGKLLASGSGDQLIKLWDLSSKKCLATLVGHTSAVGGVAFSPNGQLLASHGPPGPRRYSDRTIRLWEVSSGKNIRTIPGQPLVRAVAFSPDGALLCSVAADPDKKDTGDIRLWEVSTSNEPARPPAGACAVAFSPDGKLLATGDDQGSVKVWEIARQGGGKR